MKELLFVYYGKKGVWNGLLDSVHKITSPSTYPCKLCSLTYGLVKMNKEWKTFIQSLPMPVIFYHLDDLPEGFPKGEFPSGYVRENQNITLLIGNEELESCEDVSALIALVQKKLHLKKRD